MKKSDLWGVTAIFIITCLIFFKIFAKGLYPVPGDLLVSFYFPWYSGGWEGYNPWTTHKELLAADSIRQIYPWKEFALSQVKKGQIPTWNPYTFSGQPLLANFQSSVFYPLNIFYFVTDHRNAWILLIVTQPLLGGLLMYFALRSFNLKSSASLFGSVAFMFSSYLITWMENGNIAHGYIWFPLAIYAINKYFEVKKFRYLLILIFSLALSILAGHPQTAIYLYIATAAFWLYRFLNIPKIGNSPKMEYFKSILIYGVITVTSLTVAAIQLLPTLEFYKNSPISLPFSREVFDRSILPLKNLISFFASDFYGHPANNNFWSQSYGDFTPYFGVIPLIFSFWGIFRFWWEPFTKFAAAVSVFFIISATHGPITFLIKTFQIPVLDSTTPSRFISISIFLLIILAAKGFQDFLKNFQDKNFLLKFFKFLMPIGLVYTLLWLFAIFGSAFLEPKEVWQINLAVTRRNLILPTFMFLSIPIGTLMIQIIRVKIKAVYLWAKTLIIIGIFTVTLVGGVYYSNKFLPVAPKKYIFPEHLLFNWLVDNAQIDRFYGQGTAHIDFNFPTYYRVYGAEGYDTLRYERYAQLLASSFSGQIPKSYLRSDGVFPNEENGYRKRLFELLGVKYLLDKEDDPKTGQDWHFERFPNDNLEGFWQTGKFQVYKRSPVLPRIFLTTKYQVITSDQEIISKIYDPKFDLKTLILERNPPIEISDEGSKIDIPQILKYEPNEVEIKSNANYNSILFLSDVFDLDWHVFVDNQQTTLLRAHYALRSVAVPKGEHIVSFRYQPRSFYQGLAVSTISIIGLLILSIYFTIKRKF